MNNLKRTVLFLGFSLFLFGCKDSSSPTPKPDDIADVPANSLQSIEVPGAWKVDFFYSKGDLAGFAAFNDTLLATYDQDRIASFQSASQNISISYDANGRVIEHSWTSSPNIYRYTYEYSGSSEQPSTVTFYRTYRENNTWVEKVNIIMSNIQYNGSGGVVSCNRVYYDYGNNRTFNDDFTFELTDKPNKLYGNIPYLTYPQFTYGLVNLSKFSKLHVQGYAYKNAGTQVGSSEDFVYEFDAAYPDYISKFIRHPNSSPIERVYTWNR